MMKRNSQKGVALVITLIFLSVITFMAVTFLVISRHGAEQSSTMTQQKVASFASLAAAQQAQAQVMARMFARSNGFDFPLLVSTNYGAGYDRLSTNIFSITNVGYQYLGSTNALVAKDLQTMLNNLLILPRAPVFITNANVPSEFRFYLDLNRNRLFEDTGSVPMVDTNGLIVRDINNNIVFTNVVGDPQWVGILEHPDQRHSASNQFVARYAFFAAPIGNSLDINYIHNQAKRLDPALDGYLRDQGMGSWEINLAGFLNAVNPRWDYRVYETNSGFSSSGAAFDDSAAVLQYRYGGSFNNLKAFAFLYGLPAAGYFGNDFNDGYLSDPLMTSVNPLPTDNDFGLARLKPWSGADNSNVFFTTQDLFTFVPNATGSNFFATRLSNIGANLDTFDRYTYYRMLSQMSFGSAPDPTNKLNLNYNNVGYFTNGGKNFVALTGTNFVPWTPLQFFTNAADRLLRSQPDLATNGINITNIPVYPNNFYTPEVHRLLQVAANIYDATTNKTGTVPNDFDYPSVFRPLFSKVGTNVFISGYQEVTNFTAATQPVDLRDPTVVTTLQPTNNVYGIPWVIGAKKGFPNFNEFSMQSIVQLTRKVQIDKGTPGNPDRTAWKTNIQYVLGISNVLGVETWNSYRSNYIRAIDIRGENVITMVLTNENGTLVVSNNSIPIVATTNNWPGFISSQNTNQTSLSFREPLNTSLRFLPDSIYHANPPGSFTAVGSTNVTTFDKTSPLQPQPQFGLNITNRLRLLLVDTLSGRVIDYVAFVGLDKQRNIISELLGNDNGGHGAVWDTNRVNQSTDPRVPIRGVINQIEAAQHDPTFNGVDSNDWANANVQQAGFRSVHDAVQKFNAFYNKTDTNTTVMQVPYSPTRIISVYQTWQANDPLVHYTLSDLSGLGDLNTQPAPDYPLPGTVTNRILPNLGRVNDRYMPWDGRGNPKVVDPKYRSDVALKDPLVYSSDDWQFPTNRFANIGSLGRVHRGTPWQTIYMKSAGIDSNTWMNWTGNGLNPRVTQPTNDWGIFDLFTTAPNDNASRGQLSVNQTNFAAWAAVLDGVIVVTNNSPNYSPLVIDPNIHSNALQQIVAGINTQRTNFPGGVFTRMGDILSVSNLTVTSPFLDLTASPTATNAINDAAYERIPQQVMSLLRVGSPRYVIFAYGQSLKPADHAIVLSGSFPGMCTNYQITGEVVTRTVVRFELATSLDAKDPHTALNPSRNPSMPGTTNYPARAVIESFTILPPE